MQDSAALNAALPLHCNRLQVSVPRRSRFLSHYGPYLGPAVISSGGAHPKYHHGKCQTRRPTENPRFHNCTVYMGLMIALSVGATVLFASLLLLTPTSEVHAGKAR